MKIISLQKNIKIAVQAVNHIAQKNVSLPILNNILLSAKEGVIKLITTNLEIGITSILRGKIETEGAFTVDARTLSEYVSLLDNDKVSLELVDNELVVFSEKQTTKIKGVGADEFPLIPVIDRQQYIKIKAGVLKKALGQIVFSVSTDESRAELSGALFSLKGKKLTIVGTDSYRLAESVLAIETNFQEERQLIIPARTIQELIRIITNEAEAEEGVEDIMLYTSENQCLFIIGSVELVSRLIDGQYPDYQQIIPSKYNSQATIERAELIRAVKAAAIFSRAGVNDVIFSFSPKKGLEISASSSQSGEHQAQLAATITGDDVSITLNHRFIIDGLNALSGLNVVLEMVDDQTPCLIRDELDKEYIYIIMPIKK